MKQNILVIEDEQAIRENIVKILGYEGFEADQAENGRIGLEKARTQAPDLILCDILMPELNGYKVLTELRKDPVTARIPFIFLTAKASPEDLRQGMVLGADDYLIKPFEVDDLLAAIQTRLKKHAEAESEIAHEIEEVHRDLERALPEELQSPLTGILIYSEFLLDVDPESPPNVAELFPILQFIRESAQHLDRALQNYLLFTDLRLLQHETQRMKARQQCEPIPTAPVITLAATRKAEEMQRRDDLLLDLIEADAPIVEQDLHKIIEELVDNALKFSPSSMPVTIKSRVTQETFQLVVSDQGRGMTTRQMDEIRSCSRPEYHGNAQGLGLRICNLLVRQYDGTLHIESRPDQGTTITISFS